VEEESKNDEELGISNFGKINPKLVGSIVTSK